MKPITRKRFVRALLSSILASEMTEREVIEIMNELPYDMELIQDMKRGLATVLDLMRQTGIQQNKPTSMAGGELYETTLGEPYDLAYSIIRRRKISKPGILELMKVVNGGRGLENVSESDTVLHLLQRFYIKSSKREQESLIELLESGHGRDDAFLKGMLRGRQR